MKLFFSFCTLLVATLGATANPGDTTIVQTYTWEAQNNPNTAYDSPGRRFFTFPEDDGTTYQKVLMYHNLKCFEDGTAGNLGFPCGEWDYLTYTYLYENTGILDSNAATHPRFLWNNLDFQQTLITDDVVSDEYQYNNQKQTITQILSESAFAPVNPNGSVSLFGNALAGRSQFVWTNEELNAMGLTAGEIDKISIQAGEATGIVKRLKIRIRQGVISGLNNFIENNWTTVYDSDTEFIANESVDFFFSTPFSWNGTSDISIEFSYTNYQLLNPIAIVSESSTINGVWSNQNNLAAHFNERDLIIAHTEQLNQLNQNITVAFWMYGDPAFQPQNGTTFEGVNSANARVINSHTPWSNGRIYWDCGADENGYDRIDKLANEAQYEGRWNHWAFTKDANTGVMRMFVNGIQFHALTGLDRSISDMVRLTIGGASSFVNFYNGALDEFVILNSTLVAADLLTLMRTGVNLSSTFAPNVLLYHKFDDPNYSLTDDWNENLSSHHLGSPHRLLVNGDQLYLGAEVVSSRPAVTFYSGEYTSIAENTIGSYVWERPQTSLVEFEIQDYEPVAISRTYHWTGGYSYVFSPTGSKIDSTLIANSYAINNEVIEYYQEPFFVKNRIELGRYITPYGINLSLGPDGWTWIYDVTDFEPLLHGEVELEAGNWQELLDLKFVFIEGPEVREVKRIENVWNGDFQLSTFDQNVTERTLTREEDEVGVKLRTTITGHGFGFDNNNCGEFCYNTHSVQVNGDTEWSWEIMEDCDLNPLYPQGGTWIYARAGWCPGQEGTIQEFELTPFVSNNEVTVDYDIEFDPYGNYVTESQAIFYGPINQQNDLEIDRIIAPSNWKIDSRMNPMCDNPKVVIRNRGAQPITSATLTYRVAGGATQTYEWSGNLSFMESATVELTYSDPIMWEGGSGLLNFIVDLSSDENDSNNHAESKFNRPPVYSYNGLSDNRLIVVVRTNSANQENSWVLYDINDNIVAQRTSFPLANTFYRDTLTLNQGCYRFKLNDNGGDGLSFFANNDGNGSAALDRVNGPDFRLFNPDFGKEVDHYFYFATNLVVNIEEPLIHGSKALIFPNPANGEARLRTYGMGNTISIKIFNLGGSLCYEQQQVRSDSAQDLTLNLTQLPAGLYMVNVTDGSHHQTIKLSVE